MSLVTNTFDSFHNWATNHGVTYAVMRNYDQLPDVGNDLDLAMSLSDVNKFREALRTGLFREWDYITEITTHNSKTERINISIFRFYSLQHEEFVQFDFFQGFSIKGQQFFNVKDLLSNRRIRSGYYIVSTDVENFIKYLQVYNAVIRQQPERVQRYVSQILYDGKCNYLTKLGLNSSTLQKTLELKNFSEYRELIENSRKNFLRTAFMNAPGAFLLGFFAKLEYFISLYLLDPFGCSLSVESHANTGEIETELKGLVELKIIRSYLILQNRPFASIKCLKQQLDIRSHGGIIIKVRRSGKRVPSEVPLKKYLLNSLINSEKIIFKHANSISWS